MNTPQKTIEELRAEVNRVLMALTPREAEALRMRFGIIGQKNRIPDQEESDLHALLKELVALKHKKKS